MASIDSVQLLSLWVSPFSMRVELALNIKGVAYENLPQNLADKSPLLLQSNPVYKKVPVLLHNGKPICESSIIVQYVDEAWPSTDGHDLLPKDPYAKAIARFWADYIDKKVFDALFTVLKTKEDAQKEAVENAMQSLATLEEALGNVASEPPFFGGSRIGFVDVILGPLVAWLPTFEAAADLKFPLEEKFPLLHGWFKAIKESPVWTTFPEPEKVKEFALQFVRKRYVS